MLSKLIENWLDNASERTYQPAFCQMLISQGYTVIHSTRHCPIEYGKDVIAIAKDGVPCAFQLKGNPGGSMGLVQFRDIRPQLDEMVNQYIAHPSIPKDVPHRSFLVTNGRIEEEVALAVNQTNETNVRDGYPHRKLQTIAREQLLGWALDLEGALWPSELTELRTLLEMLTHKGNELFPIGKLHHLLSVMLRMRPSDGEKIGDAEFGRRLSGAALLVAVALKSFSENNNHFAVVSAWVAFSTYAIGFADKYRKSNTLVQPTLASAEDAIHNSLSLLLNEASKRRGIYGEGNGLADFPVYPWRYTLLVGLASLYWLECTRTGIWQNPEQQAEIEAIIPGDDKKMSLWGEGAIPQFLFYNWYLKKRQDITSDYQIVSLADIIMSKPLFNVYLQAEDVIRHQLSQTFEAFNSFIDQKLGDKASSSYFSATAMALLAQRDLKDACKKLWGRYSKISSLSFLPQETWMYCLYTSEAGDNHSYIPPETGQWVDLLATSRIDAGIYAPPLLLERPLLLALWCLLIPQRTLVPIACQLYSALSGYAQEVARCCPTDGRDAIQPNAANSGGEG